MCLIRVKTILKKHPILAAVGIALFAISTLLTVRMYSQDSQDNTRELFVVSADGSRTTIHHIELQSQQMVPDALSIRAGEYIQFNPADNREHKVGLGGGDEYDADHEHTDADFASDTFGGGNAYRVQIKEKGVYEFHDHLHAELFVTVVAY